MNIAVTSKGITLSPPLPPIEPVAGRSRLARCRIDIDSSDPSRARQHHKLVCFEVKLLPGFPLFLSSARLG